MTRTPGCVSGRMLQLQLTNTAGEFFVVNAPRLVRSAEDSLALPGFDVTFIEVEPTPFLAEYGLELLENLGFVIVHGIT